jgi:Methylase involved in ubiquinone/menaquinone biosynthesis
MYSAIYDFFCGPHPYQNILHHEWLCTKDLHTDLHTYASYIKGKTLDAGCGSKPYEKWFSGVTEYIGLDIGNNSQADFLVEDNQPWPFPDSTFDSIVSFQTFEHIRDIKLVLSEINRVVKPGGVICISMPFIAYEHAAPSDYRRVSKHGIMHFFPDFEVIKVIPQGRFGSTSGTLILDFIRTSMLGTRATRILWGFLMPAWILFTAFIGVCGWFFDKIDTTEKFYQNVMLLAQKPK